MIFPKLILIATLTFLLVRLADAQSRAEKIEQYKISMEMWTRNLAVAFSASICNLRSDQWWNVFHTYDALRSDRDIRRFNFTDKELAKLADDRRRVWRATVKDLTCRKLFNSPELDQLDEIETRLTGNYH